MIRATTALLLSLSLSACLLVPDDNPGTPSTTSGSPSSSESTMAPELPTMGIMTTTEDDQGFSVTGAPEPDTSGSSGAVEGNTNSSSGSDSSGSSSTGGDIPVNVCGTPDQECTIADKDCTVNCTWETRTIFVSSIESSPDFGVFSPDVFCNQVACGVDDCGFTALLRYETTFWGPTEDFQGRYVMPSGTIVSEGLDGIQHPINRPNEDESGNLVPAGSPVWTGYNPDVPELTCYTCDENKICTPWSGQGEGKEGRVGVVGGVESFWYDESTIPCNSAARVYCVQ